MNEEEPKEVVDGKNSVPPYTRHRWIQWKCVVNSRILFCDEVKIVWYFFFQRFGGVL